MDIKIDFEVFSCRSFITINQHDLLIRNLAPAQNLGQNLWEKTYKTSARLNK